MKFIFFMPYLTAIAVTSLCLGVMYVAEQQNFRSHANDPQVQLATDIRNYLESGQMAEKWLPNNIDLSRSLGLFVTLYDKNERLVHSTGFLEEKTPLLPKGIFDYVNSHGEERVTWQPRHDIRLAMIIVSVKSPAIGFVAVGRSLKEVEARTSNLLHIVFIGWIFATGLIVLSALILFKNTHP
jgi:hypothetical protein